MTPLTCSCCGSLFNGIQETTHDDGYGTCSHCVTTVIEPKINQELDKIVTVLEQRGSKDFLESFTAKDQVQKRQFALKCVEKGLINWSFGG
ncbi:hypothetical protein [Vibrio chaetopteri]|uniref:Uncharacterized protein n=1 Tax=Vibrio chaetopteri TaxID=3016528 RepID=A0AAU8BS56_9VIBR